MSIIIPFNALYECFLIWNSFLALFFPFWHQMECRLPIFLPFSYSDAFNDERRCTLTFSFFFFFIIISPLGGWWLTSVGLVRQKRPHLLSLSLSIFPAPRFHVQKVDDACTSYATTTTTLLFEFSVFFFCPHIMTSSILILTPNQKKSKVKSLFFCCCFFNTGRRMYP